MNADLSKHTSWLGWAHQGGIEAPGMWHVLGLMYTHFWVAKRRKQSN